jgi:hypothetical protein
MTDQLQNTLNRWLGFEEGDQEAAADLELVRLFSLIPSPVPSENFVDQVMVRSGVVHRAELLVGRPLRTAMKMALCFTLLLSALTAAVAPGVLIPLLKLLSPTKLLEIGVDMTVELFRRLAESVAVWRALAGFGEAISRLVQSPVGMATLIIGFILSAGALRALSVLIDSDQRGGYVSFV